MTGACRIIVTGPIGAGKSTFAAALCGEIGLPHIELDPIYIRVQGWLPGNRDALQRALETQFEAHPDGWIVDGGQRQALQLIVGQADELVWLNFGAHLVFPRLIRRTIARRRNNEVLWGHDEPRRSDLFWRRSPVLWGAALWRMHQRETRAYLRQRHAGMNIAVLRSSGAAARYLADAGSSR